MELLGVWLPGQRPRRAVWSCPGRELVEAVADAEAEPANVTRKLIAAHLVDGVAAPAFRPPGGSRCWPGN